jgi:hypothetical protein
MTITDGPRAVVGITPAAQLGDRARLFAALEQALPVRFEGLASGDVDGLDAVVVLGADAPEADGDGAGPQSLPRFIAAGEERTVATGPATVALALGLGLDRRLHGARLTEGVGDGVVAPPSGATVLASTPAGPAWVRAGADVVAACAPAELGDEEALRDRLVPGRSLALLALVHFLREVTAPYGWTAPPLQAAFIVDDPNLHWPRYGHLDYRALVAHSAAHRHHLSVAMVPLDGWLVHPTAASLFREHPGALSILVHGNDHVGGELARPRTPEEGRVLGASALRRIASFERRSRVDVCRVMAPPHERVSEGAARGLLQAGYEAACMSRPYPWLAQPDKSFLIRPEGADVLTGWRPADVTSGGLPVILRNAFTHPREDLVLRAFLGQPLVLYGHHGDFADMDLLAEAASQINALGDVTWRRLSAISQSLADTRREGEVLRVRPWTRHVRVEVPAGVSTVVVEERDGTARELPVGGPGPLSIRAESGIQMTGSTGASLKAWPVARRLAGEGRDRLTAALERR